jgi:hypothetical protein
VAQDLCYTDPVQKNLTLSVDADVLKAARRIALERDTSVNRIVQEFLVQLVESTDERRTRAAEELKQLFRTSKYRMGPKTWTRDDLHER